MAITYKRHETIKNVVNIYENGRLIGAVSDDAPAVVKYFGELADAKTTSTEAAPTEPKEAFLKSYNIWLYNEFDSEPEEWPKNDLFGIAACEWEYDADEYADEIARDDLTDGEVIPYQVYFDYNNEVLLYYIGYDTDGVLYKTEEYDRQSALADFDCECFDAYTGDAEEYLREYLAAGGEL